MARNPHHGKRRRPNLMPKAEFEAKLMLQSLRTRGLLRGNAKWLGARLVIPMNKANHDNTSTSGTPPPPPPPDIRALIRGLEAILDAHARRMASAAAAASAG